MSQKNIIIGAVVGIICFSIYFFGSKSADFYHNADRVNNVRQSIDVDNKRLEKSIGDIGESSKRVQEAIGTNSELAEIVGKAKESNGNITGGIDECKVIIDRNIRELEKVQSRIRTDFPINQDRK